MPKSNGQKIKILALYKILFDKTDDNNGLTMSEIIETLEKEYSIKTERKSIYDDLKALEQFDVDIIRKKTDTTRYSIGVRTFELAELKILIDAVQCSKSLTEEKSKILIEKIKKLTSKKQASEIQRQMYFKNRVKSINKEFFIAVDTINNAITENKKINFYYLQWVITPGVNSISQLELVRKKDEEKININKENQDINQQNNHMSNEKLYICSPLALCWNDENYYMIAYDNLKNKIRHYRVDKMEKVVVSDFNCEYGDEAINFDVSEYTKKHFFMYGGEEDFVTLSLKNNLAGVIADRFGKNCFIFKYDDESFWVCLNICISKTFYGWLAGLGDDAKILYPKKIAKEYNDYLKKILNNYNNLD